MQLIKAGGLIAVIPYISGTPSAPKEDNSETKHTELLHKLKITWPEFFQSNIKSNKIEVLEENSIGYYNDKHKKSPGFSKTKSNDDTEEDTATAAWQKQRDEFEYYRTYGYECYSKYGNTYYKKYDTWYTQRPFMASDLLAYYKCTCEGGETGRYTCIPDSVPCFSQATKNTYDVNESWDWHRTISFGIGKQVEDLYECHCEGGPTGKYKCSEKVQGCIDARYNMMKYQINELFNQTREDGLTYECQCNKGERDEDRIIKCSLRNYCIYAGETHMVGDEWNRHNRYTGQPEHKCSCKRHPANPNSNIVQCKYIHPPQEARQQEPVERQEYNPPSRSSYMDNMDNMDSRGYGRMPQGVLSQEEADDVDDYDVMRAQSDRENGNFDDNSRDYGHDMHAHMGRSGIAQLNRQDYDDNELNADNIANYSVDDLPNYPQPDPNSSYFTNYDESDYDDYVQK